MRTIILYASRHHGNTKKLVDAIVEAHPEIDTLDVKAPRSTRIWHAYSPTCCSRKTRCLAL